MSLHLELSLYSEILDILSSTYAIFQNGSLQVLILVVPF